MNKHPIDGAPNGVSHSPIHETPPLKGTTSFTPLPDTRNIMITGAAGFIASWLTRHLTLTYPNAYTIVAFDTLDYCASLNNLDRLSNLANFQFYRGDVTSSVDVMECLHKHNIDTIFHFAAQSHVDLSFGNSYKFTQTNVYGTHVLLECAKEAKISRFIHVSTDEVYGEVNDEAKDLMETSLLAPTNPYAASKAAAEMLVSAYRKSFKLPVLTVRINNVYGPHQYPEKIIPKFILLLTNDRHLPIHGSGTNTRRYLHASDAADAFDTILHKGSIGQIYNIGSSDEISNLELCKRLLDIFQKPCSTDAEVGEWVTHTQDRPFNDRRYAIDTTKLRTLGWRQRVAFEEGLQSTVEWYRQYGSWWWGDVESVLTPFPVAVEDNDTPAKRIEGVTDI